MPFDLNLRHLRALGAIARRGGMSAAADAVGLSQPALTQGLAKLEAQLGTRLFERLPDGMAPTAEGRIMVDRIDAAIAHLAAAVGGRARGFARPERLMTATQLRAFLALADAGSFVGAAQATGLTQPALHRSARDLEQITGGALIERRGRGVALTAAGKRLARGIRLAAAEIRAGVAETAPSARGTGHIALGAMPLSRATLVPQATAALVAEWPGTTISILEGSWRELVEPLREGVIDLMVGALRPIASPDLVQTPLHDDRPVVVGGAHHPLAGIEAVTLDALAAYPWIVGHADSPLRAQWDMMFAGAPAPPERPVECGSALVMRGLLCRGDFLTLLSPDQVSLEISNGILSRIAAPPARNVRTIGVTTRADWRPTAAQQRFLDHLHRAADHLKLHESE